MVAVVGAGPAGCWYAAQARAGAGDRAPEVHLFEDHAEVGRPVACTGILTDSVRSVIGDVPEDLVVSRIRRFKLVAPNGSGLYVDLDRENLILDRARFDLWLLGRAVAAGATLHLGERFVGYERRGAGYRVTTTRGSYDAEMIVGADGPFSAVARAGGIYGERSFVMGWQSRCRTAGLEPGVTEVRLTLGEFSWIVPEDGETARVGVIGRDTPRLREEFEGLEAGAEVIEDQSGMIPVYDPRQKLRVPGEKVFLIGDAATQVKATTYGGIIYGLIAGSALAQDPERYEQAMAARVNRDLWLSLRIRGFMNAMTEEQADELLAIFEKQGNRQLIERHDRDFPSRFIVQLLLKETRLWKLGFELFRGRLAHHGAAAAGPAAGVPAATIPQQSAAEKT